jgi:hypothetical protein
MRLQKSSHEGVPGWSTSVGGIPDSPVEAPLPTRRSPKSLNPRWQSGSQWLVDLAESSLWLPRALQWKVLKSLHQLYHLGLENTLILTRKMFKGVGVKDIVQQVL